MSYLNVFMNQDLVGQLLRKANGAIEFQYDETWINHGFPISLSLPFGQKKFRGQEVAFYFDNLLPDNKNVLTAIAEKFGAASTRQFDLLEVIGHECVGALSFFPESVVPQFENKMRFRQISEAEIEKRILNLAIDTPLGMEGDFRISIAGVQEKTALLRKGNKWYEPIGQTPTTHILKKSLGKILGGIDFSKSCENELICLRLAEAFGIKTCKAHLETFGDQTILCVERFDRIAKDGQLYRIPQEDFCQALGVSPHKKYERQGGPSLGDVMELVTSSNNAPDDRKTLFKLAMFNDLVFNTDGHSKNISIYLTKIGFAMTPAYDLLSAHFLKDNHPDRFEVLRSSWSVNNKFIYAEIDLQDWDQESQKCGLTKTEFATICEEMIRGVVAVPSIVWDASVDSEQIEIICSGLQTRSRALGLV